MTRAVLPPSVSFGTRLPSCSIYLYEPLRTIDSPREWMDGEMHHRNGIPTSSAGYSAAAWIVDALQRSPWRVRDPRDADVVFVETQFLQLCSSAHLREARMRLHEALHSPLLPNGTLRAGAFPAEGPCVPREATGMIALREILPAAVVASTLPRHAVSPAVVSALGREWLMRHEARPERNDWQRRKLVFSAAHTPTLWLNPTRYRIWRQIRQQTEDVTLSSPDLQCSVGSYRACRTSAPLAEEARRRFLVHFCHSAGGCPAQLSCLRRIAPTRPLTELQQAFDHICDHYYRDVNFTAEGDDMKRDTRRLSLDEYLTLSMHHRFCLVTPGDQVWLAYRPIGRTVLRPLTAH